MLLLQFIFYEGHGTPSFRQLIDVPIEKSFICPSCGLSPEIIVTMIGMRKDLIPAIGATSVNNDQSSEKIKGSVHAERILIKTKKGQELLLKYSGYTKARRCIAQPQKLSTKEFC